MEFRPLIDEIESFLPIVMAYRDDADAARIVTLASVHHRIISDITYSSTPVAPAAKTAAYSNYIEFHQIVVEYINKKKGE